MKEIIKMPLCGAKVGYNKYMKIIRKSDVETSVWSGGTTTELAIWPKGAVYADGDFKWRLSSAEVNDEKSTFTPLPDYMRFITIRKGTLRLKHDDGAWYEISEGDVSEFDGGSATESEGRVTDFNLMLRKGVAEGTLDVEFTEAGETLELEPAEADGFTAIFLSRGKTLQIAVGEEEAAELEEGDLLLIGEGEAASDLTAFAESDSCIIRADIILKKLINE